MGFTQLLSAPCGPCSPSPVSSPIHSLLAAHPSVPCQPGLLTRSEVVTVCQPLSICYTSDGITSSGMPHHHHHKPTAAPRAPPHSPPSWVNPGCHLPSQADPLLPHSPHVPTLTTTLLQVHGISQTVVLHRIGRSSLLGQAPCTDRTQSPSQSW